MLRNLFFSFVFLFFCASINEKLSAEIPNITKDFRARARQIMNKTGLQLRKKYNFEISGTCAGMMDNVESVGMDFIIKRKLSKQEARAIVVDCTNLFLKNFNEDLEIRPFLKQYPLKPENVSVIIHIKTPHGDKIYDPDLSTVAAYSKRVFFMTRSQKKEFGYESEIEEPFDEAVRIVQAGIQNTND